MLRFRAWGPLAALVACSVAVADTPAARVAPLSPEAMVAAMHAERDAYSRRLDVCTQLRRVALETNDAKLEAEALQLEQMAETTYKQRVAKLGVKSDPRPPVAPIEIIGRGAAPTPQTSPAPSTNFRVVKP